jgi:hypothetical protein
MLTSQTAIAKPQARLWCVNAGLCDCTFFMTILTVCSCWIKFYFHAKTWMAILIIIHYCVIKVNYVNGGRERNEVKRPDIPRVIRSLRYASFPAAIGWLTILILNDILLHNFTIFKLWHFHRYLYTIALFAVLVFLCDFAWNKMIQKNSATWFCCLAVNLPIFPVDLSFEKRQRIMLKIFIEVNGCSRILLGWYKVFYRIIIFCQPYSPVQHSKRQDI